MFAFAGVLKTLGANKDSPLPIRLFEISDVIQLDSVAETGARNERHLVAAVCAKDSTFETIHGFLNRIMEVLGMPPHVPGLGANLPSIKVLPLIYGRHYIPAGHTTVPVLPNSRWQLVTVCIPT